MLEALFKNVADLHIYFFLKNIWEKLLLKLSTVVYQHSSLLKKIIFSFLFNKVGDDLIVWVLNLQVV